MALTSEQKEIWNSDETPKLGLHIVSARAGTGKTTLLTQYCFDVSNEWSRLGFQEWQGLAILSYTNVAKSELEQKMKGEGRGFALLESPNTIQTLDSFVNDRVFLPYGNSAMNSPISRPLLIGEPMRPLKLINSTKAYYNKAARSYQIVANTFDKKYYFDKCNFDIRGGIMPPTIPVKKDARGTSYVQIGIPDVGAPVRLNWISAKDKYLPLAQSIVDFKKEKHVEGFASQSDANYFALLTLKGSQRLTRSIIHRFPVVIIDEAQDMTEVQHAMIDHLIENGLKNVIMVGDDHQAIYEWNTARPELFTSKYNSSNTLWDAHEVTKTFRNSQSICHMLNSLDGVTGIQPANTAKSITRNYSDPVYIIDWMFSSRDAATFKAILNDCAKTISGKKYAHNDHEKNLAIIMRSSKDVEILREMFVDSASTNEQEPLQFKSHESKDMLRLLYSFKHGAKGEVIKRYEKLLMTLYEQEALTDLRQLIVSKINIEYDDEYFSYRKALYEDTAKLNEHFKTSGEKLSATAAIDHLNLICMPTSDKLQGIINDYFDTMLTLDEIFMDKTSRLPEYHPDYPDVKLVFSTAHGVKGETYDGVLLIQKHTGNSCNCEPSQKQPIEIADHPLDCEEKRIQYVAMSRAAQTLWLAVDPNSYSGKPSDVERWKNKAKGEISSFQSLSFGRLWRQKCADLKYADANLSKALLACSFSKDGAALTIFMPTGKKARQSIVDNNSTVRNFINIHLPGIETITIL